MATRSSVSAITKDGIKSIYVHWDGYIEGVGKTLYHHYTNQKKIEELINIGDMSSLAGTIKESSKGSYQDSPPTTLPDWNFRELYNNFGNDLEYHYFWNGHQWYVLDRNAVEPDLVEERLTTINRLGV